MSVRSRLPAQKDLCFKVHETTKVSLPSFGGVAQLAERLVCNEKDAGSNPVTSTISGSMYQGWRECFAGNLRWVQFPPAPQNAKIAQLVERHLAKVEVAGSNPVFRSKGN